MLFVAFSVGCPEGAGTEQRSVPTQESRLPSSSGGVISVDATAYDPIDASYMAAPISEPSPTVGTGLLSPADNLKAAMTTKGAISLLHCASVNSRHSDQFGGDVVSDVTFEVSTTFRGTPPTTLTVEGGRVGDHSSFSSHGLRFVAGHDYLIFFQSNGVPYLVSEKIETSLFYEDIKMQYDDIAASLRTGSN